jgi:hypothetical protein
VQINANHPLEAIDGLLSALADVWQQARLPVRRRAAAAS